MRAIFHFLLCFYVLSLSLVPCDDSDACGTQQELTMSLDDHRDHEEDACSPFCLCACCSSQLLITSQEIDIPLLLTASAPYADFERRVPQKVLSSIWQPPKLV